MLGFRHKDRAWLAPLLCLLLIAAVPQERSAADGAADIRLPMPQSAERWYVNETMLSSAYRLPTDVIDIVMSDLLSVEPAAGPVPKIRPAKLQKTAINPQPKPAQPPAQFIADLPPISLTQPNGLANDITAVTQPRITATLTDDAQQVTIAELALDRRDFEKPFAQKAKVQQYSDTAQAAASSAQAITPGAPNTIVTSAQNTDKTYVPQPLGLGGVETLRDAVEHAVATNPDVKIAQARQEDAFYAVREARAGFLPKLDLNAGAGPEVSRQSGAEEIVRIRQELNATLRQTVFDFGLTEYDYLRAKEGYESAKLQTLQSIEELVYDVSVAYLGVLQQQNVVALAGENVSAHEAILTLVTAQKEAGQGTAADVNRVSSSLANARSFMLEEESKLQQSRDQYRRLLNVPPGFLVDPVLNLGLLPKSADEAATRIAAESPQLLQVKADTKSVQNQLRSQRGNYFPRVDFEVQGNINTDVAGETGRTRDARAMMFLRYNVFNGGADAAVSARLRARLKEVGYEFEKQRREVEQNIRNDFTAIEASRAKVETIRDQVDAAKEVVRLYREQFRAGDRSAFDLLDAQQALINAKLEQILNGYQETRAGFRVMQQLGSLYYSLTAD
ncbi:MAG: TolC family outer membrane protein [Pseudomonadota bacterium]